MLRRTTTVLLAISMLATLAGCRGAPSRAEALEAIRAASPGLDTTTTYARVWKDGPPWFSCAEVLAKIGSRSDAHVVYEQVGNWRPLVVAGWLVLRDTTHGIVSDPGWCAGKLVDEDARRAGGWVPIVGDSFPTGDARRGWRVPIGRVRFTVTSAPTRIGTDSATVEYVTTIQTNANGAAMAADRDSAYAVALMRRVEGRWRVASTSPRGETGMSGVAR
jgi:hypothetical protein